MESWGKLGLFMATFDLFLVPAEGNERKARKGKSCKGNKAKMEEGIE